MRIYTGVKPYTCSECGQCASQTGANTQAQSCCIPKIASGKELSNNVSFMNVLPSKTTLLLASPTVVAVAEPGGTSPGRSPGHFLAGKNVELHVSDPLNCRDVSPTRLYRDRRVRESWWPLPTRRTPCTLPGPYPGRSPGHFLAGKP